MADFFAERIIKQLASILVIRSDHTNWDREYSMLLLSLSAIGAYVRNAARREINTIFSIT